MRHLILIAFVVSVLVLAGCSGTPTGSFVGVEDDEPQAGAGAAPAKNYINTCTDSEDGINERIKGTVTGMLNGVKYEIEDKCIKKDYVIDYYCDGDVYKNKNFVCQCSDGACHD